MTLIDTSMSNHFEMKNIVGISTSCTSPNKVYQLRGSLNKFLDFFCMGTFIDSTHMKL